MMDLAAPSILRNEDSVDDITDYVFAYGNKACQILFVAFLLPAVAVCVECAHLYSIYDDLFNKTLYIDSLRLDIMVHSALALSFFILFNCIKIVYNNNGNQGGENERKSGRNFNLFCILASSFLFVAIVFAFIVSLVYLLISSIISTENFNVASSSSTCGGDFINLVLSLVLVIIIRRKNRTHVLALINRSVCLSSVMTHMLTGLSYFFEEIKQVKDNTSPPFPSYGSTDDAADCSPDLENASSLGYSSHDSASALLSDIGGSGRFSDSDIRISLAGQDAASRLSSSGRISSGRRSLSRTSDLAYQVGTRVLAKWVTEGTGGKMVVSWYPATIVYVYKDSEERMYDIVYYDGDVEKKKHHESVHEYDEALDTNNYNIVGKSRRMKFLMLLWLSILYSYCFLKLVALAFNAIVGKCHYIESSPFDCYIQRFHIIMTCVTFPLVIGSIVLWFTATGHCYIMITSFKSEGGSNMKHIELVVQSIECVLKIPLQPKRSMHKPVKYVSA